MEERRAAERTGGELLRGKLLRGEFPFPRLDRKAGLRGAALHGLDLRASEVDRDGARAGGPRHAQHERAESAADFQMPIAGADRDARAERTQPRAIRDPGDHAELQPLRRRVVDALVVEADRASHRTWREKRERAGAAPHERELTGLSCKEIAQPLADDGRFRTAAERAGGALGCGCGDRLRQGPTSVKTYGTIETSFTVPVAPSVIVSSAG
jgi:hypothetical protein